MMTRKDFLKACVLLGMSTAIPSGLASCVQSPDSGSKKRPDFKGKVLIIGAGSAGLMAAYTLQKRGIDFKLLEASSRFGGRVKKLEGFADFPIDLGAEWIHTNPKIFSELTGSARAYDQIQTIEYNPKTISIWDDQELKKRDFLSHFYSEYKFKNSTWWDFFASYVVPSFADNIHFNKEVVEIDYSNEQTLARASDGSVYTADRVIIAAPLTILKRNAMNFTPRLPESKVEALSQVDMPDGLKVFLKFSERFYPDMTFEGGILENLLAEDDGEKTIYDVAYGKESTMNILGLFSVGKSASVYTRQKESELIPYFIKELDAIFGGQASKYYVDHALQNWSTEPFIWGSYSHYREDEAREVLMEPIDNKLFFAGEYCANDADLATVHGAGRSGISTVDQLLVSIDETSYNAERR